MTDLQTLLNIERTVLSAVLFDYSIFEELTLKTDDFYHLGHQKCFECMTNLYNQNMPIDETFIQKEFQDKKLDENILIEILTANPVGKVSAYEEQIKENSKKRKLDKLSATTKKLALESETTSSDAIDTVQKELNAIDNDIPKTRTISDIVDAFNKKVKLAKETNGPIGLKTSISYLNNLVGAFEPGKLTVIGARPSMGKTALGCNFINDFLNPNLNPEAGVLCDSLEMPSEDIIKRLVACRNLESLTDLKNGEVRDYHKYHETLKFYATNQNFVLHDIRGLTFRQLAAKARKVFRTAQKQGKPLTAWLIDHIGKVRITNPINKRIEMADGTQELLNVAVEFGVHLFILTQLNRDVTNRKSFRPQLSDIKETGTLEEDADIVIFPHRESYYQRADKSQQEALVNDAELIIPKNRDGQSGIVKTSFNGPFNLFGNKDIPIEVVFQSDQENKEETIDIPDIL